ncbi:YdeI/OmpD-associated family protein [Yoonia sp. 208BN28-4]|uniref:YdeI/OmpD-associated family protein n=1 Tax=Yoonia sp. 208BN28-4 TaxID=3126505 RepID=UPI0030AAF46D
MPDMTTDPQVFFDKGCGRCARFDTPDCASRIWAEGVAALRDICLGAGLHETAKWGFPVYMQGKRNIAMIGASQAHFSLSFFHAGLLDDPAGVLQKSGPHTQTADHLRFASLADLAAMASRIDDFLAQAKANAAANRKPAKTQAQFDLPQELVDALDADDELAAAFAALTRGRQRSYAIVIGQAKKAETRITRIAKYRDKIIAGKGTQDY